MRPDRVCEPDLPRYPLPADGVYGTPLELSGRRSGPAVFRVVLPTGDVSWIVTGYAEVRTVLTDARFSRAAACREGAPRLRPLPPDPTTILAMDPPEHTRLHRMAARAFGTGRIRALRPFLDQVTTELTDAIAEADPPADLVTGLALPLPIAAICQLLGVPYRDRPQFGRWTDDMLNRSGDAVVIAESRTRLNSYMRELVVSKRATPTDDLVSDLIHGHAEPSEMLSDQEVAVFASTLLIAGYHTTAGALTNAMVLLFRNRDVLAGLTDGTLAVSSVVGEVLRLSTAAAGGGNLRVALEDVDLGGVRVRRGDAILPSIVGANRDPAVFTTPDDLDPHRGQRDLAFGAGAHHCVGARLARAELEVAIHAVTRRFVGLAPACAESDLTTNGSAITNLTSLPFTWSAIRRREE